MRDSFLRTSQGILWLLVLLSRSAFGQLFATRRDVDPDQCIPASPAYAERKPLLTRRDLIRIVSIAGARQEAIVAERQMRSLFGLREYPYIYELMAAQFLYTGSRSNWDDEESSAGALAKIAIFRYVLGETAVFETYETSEPIGGEAAANEISCPSSTETARTPDGSCNDRNDPLMGSAQTRFFRNVPIEKTFLQPDLLMVPNPRKISTDLLARTGDGSDAPKADFLNMLSVAWIQMMTHDWFVHANDMSFANMIEVPLPDDDVLREAGIDHLNVMRSLPDPTQSDAERPTFLNQVTHWWDGSHLYGSDRETEERLRSGVDGKLLLISDQNGSSEILLPERFGRSDSGFTENWWVGLELLHTLFVLEHNAICDMLIQSHSNSLSDQELFDKARLINAAVMAKIHTVEWTPAILPNPYLEVGMNSNWYGFYDMTDAQLPPFIDRIPSSDLGLNGIVGNERYLAGHRYALTEEFVAVYRFHELLPEELSILSDEGSFNIPTKETLDADARELVKEYGMETLLESFGAQEPTAVVIHNMPKFLQDLKTPHGIMDLGTIDILRDRERGIPRYNEFRRLVALPPVTSFVDLTGGDEALALEIAEVYDNDIELVDLQVGLKAEGNRPKCYGFSETAFQIFIIQASYRLQKDRFFTDDYRPEIYTQVGLDWVDSSDFKSVLLRHFPNLASTGLANVANAFTPWK